VLFNVHRDSGDLIEGYLIPDGFSDVPKVLVSDTNGNIAEIACDQRHNAIVAAGRHETGLVGFKLTDDNIPRLSERSTLFIRDAKSGFLLYRRPLVEQIPMRILRIETQLLPHVAFDREMVRRFQYSIPLIERFGQETILQAFLLDDIKSIYLSGRLQTRNYQESLDKKFKGVALLTAPYYEMALRIATLKRAATVKPTFLGDRDLISLAPAIDYFKDVNLQDTDAIGKALKKAPPRVRIVLLSPLTRQFACADAEQPPARRDIAVAMDLISRFAIIGHINDTLAFASSLGELLGMDMEEIPIRQRNPALDTIADELRTLAVAETYLEDDLILDYYVRQAMETKPSQ